MTRFRNYISIAFLLLAVAGLLSSMAHYHSDGLECLHHANEQHYTESDPVCPVCTISSYTPDVDAAPFIHNLEYQEVLVLAPDINFLNEPFTPLLGRSPPALI